MALDLFQRDEQEAMRLAGESLAPRLPSDFAENFQAAWREGALFGQSLSNLAARGEAIQDYVDEIKSFHGVTINPLAPEGIYDLASVNREIARVREGRHDLGLEDLTETEIERRAVAKSRAARETSQALAAGDRTTGGAVGAFLGQAASGITDPINLLALPLAAPVGAGIIGTTLAWAAIGGGTQLAIEAVGAPYRETVEPDYIRSGEAAGNVVGAALFGGALGGGVKTLAAGWRLVRDGAWPRTIRDAGNVVESEAQIADTNRLPGVDGEVAHRTALRDAIDALISGRPVEPGEAGTPAITAAYEQRLGPIMEARATALAAGEGAPAGPLRRHVTALAREVGYDMPGNEAETIAAAVRGATSDDEARAIVDELMLRPRTLADTLPVAGVPPLPEPPPVSEAPLQVRTALNENFTPKRLEEMRSAPEVADAIRHDVDNLLAERGGDIEIPIAESVGSAGERLAVTRSLRDILVEADSREMAAREIEACLTPQRGAA